MAIEKVAPVQGKDVIDEKGDPDFS